MARLAPFMAVCCVRMNFKLPRQVPLQPTALMTSDNGNMISVFLILLHLLPRADERVSEIPGSNLLPNKKSFYIVPTDIGASSNNHTVQYELTTGNNGKEIDQE